MGQETGLDLKVYWGVFSRWWWIFAIALVAATALVLYLDNTKTPVYQASSRIFVQGGSTLGAPSASDIATSEALANTYSDLIMTRPILEQVGRELNLGGQPEGISIRSSGSFIQIIVTDPDPELAALVATTTARTFIDDFRTRQFTQIAQFQASLGQFQIEETSAIVAAQAATLTTLGLIEEAVPPLNPTRVNTKVHLFFGVVVGLLAAGGLVFLLEYFDDRLKSADELKAVTGLSTMGRGMLNLGSVLYHPGKGNGGPVGLGDDERNRPMAEAYKFLRTNLEFAALEFEALKTDGLRSLLVTSSVPGEGKTTTASNLAISIAREGQSVILVDSDLRKPGLHRVFGVSLNEVKGLTHLILGKEPLENVLTSVGVDGLKVIFTGPLPPDATSVLRSPRMPEVVELLKNSAGFVIFDSPPLLSVTDALLLAPMTDGVLLVVDANRTGRSAIKRGAETLLMANPKVVGTVLNKVTSRRIGYGGYYRYYDYMREDANGSSNGHRFKLPFGKKTKRQKVRKP